MQHGDIAGECGTTSFIVTAFDCASVASKIV